MPRLQLDSQLTLGKPLVSWPVMWEHSSDQLAESLGIEWDTEYNARHTVVTPRDCFCSALSIAKKKKSALAECSLCARQELSLHLRRMYWSAFPGGGLEGLSVHLKERY